MQRAKKIFLTGLALSSFAIGMASSLPKRQDIYLRDPSRISSVNAFQYLNSFAGASMSFGNDVFLFSGSKMVGQLFGFQHIERPQVLQYWINFDITYIVGLDVGFIDVSFVEPVTERVIASDNVFAYPYEDENHFRDTTFVLNDAVFNGGDFVFELEVKTEHALEITKANAHSLVSQAVYTEAVSGISFSYGDGSGPASDIPTKVESNIAGTIYPIIATLEAISSFDEVVGFARKRFPIPNLLLEPDDFLMYWIKMAIIEENFKNNINLSIPITSGSIDHTHIYNQHVLNGQTVGWVIGSGDPNEMAWQQWRFGYSNMADAGCAVFATYNLLVDLDYQVNLAVLIALFELGNADLLYAMFGGCPLSELTINEIRDTIVLSLIAMGIGLSFIPVVGTALFFASISLAVVLNTVAEVALSRQRGLEDILSCLEIYTYSESIPFGLNLYSKFKNALADGKMGIACFWNDLNPDLTPKLSSVAHYVYVRNDGLGLEPFATYNVRCETTTTYSSAELPHLMNVSYNDEKAERAMIAFYVI